MLSRRCFLMLSPSHTSTSVGNFPSPWSYFNLQWSELTLFNHFCERSEQRLFSRSNSSGSHRCHLDSNKTRCQSLFLVFVFHPKIVLFCSSWEFLEKSAFRHPFRKFKRTLSSSSSRAILNKSLICITFWAAAKIDFRQNAEEWCMGFVNYLCFFAIPQGCDL